MVCSWFAKMPAVDLLARQLVVRVRRLCLASPLSFQENDNERIGVEVNRDPIVRCVHSNIFGSSTIKSNRYETACMNESCLFVTTSTKLACGKCSRLWLLITDMAFVYLPFRSCIFSNRKSRYGNSICRDSRRFCSKINSSFSRLVTYH